MDITTREEGAVLVVDLAGRLDIESADAVEAPLLGHVQGRRQVLINLAQVGFVGSAGLRVVIKAAKQIKAGGGSLKFCNATAGVAKVFEISGLDSLLELHDDEAEALASY